MKILSEGSVKDRVAVVLNALMADWELRQDTTAGSILIDPVDRSILVIPRDVMEYMIDEELIDFTPQVSQ